MRWIKLNPVIAAFIASLFIATCGCRSRVERSEVARSQSPDGKWVAVFLHSFFLGDVDGDVSIFRASEVPKEIPIPGNVFSCVGSGVDRVEWVSSNKLVIFASSRCNVNIQHRRIKEQSLHGIDIEYRFIEPNLRINSSPRGTHREKHEGVQEGR